MRTPFLLRLKQKHVVMRMASCLMGLFLSACLAEPMQKDDLYPPGPYGNATGQVLADFRLTNLEGVPFTMQELYGDASPLALLYITANWCFTCGPEVAWLNKQQE